MLIILCILALLLTKTLITMKSIYDGQYKEGEHFKSHKKVKSLKAAMNHPLVSGIEYHYPDEVWGDMPMFIVNLSDEAINFWVSCEIGEHMASINIYGDTKKEAMQEVFWLLNDSFSYQVKIEQVL